MLDHYKIVLIGVALPIVKLQVSAEYMHFNKFTASIMLLKESVDRKN